jgi:hypothetical protein
MPYAILGIGLLLLLIVAVRFFVAANPAKLSQFLGWFVAGLGLAGAGALLVVLIIGDRLGPALAVAGGLAPLVFRGRAWWRRYQGAAATGPTGQSSDVETDLLRMQLDHDTGTMSGRARRGPFAGRLLDDLDQADLMTFWRQCVAEDEPSARLLESYLDRLRPDWRQEADGDAAPGEAMTLDEAYAILDLTSGATVEQIKNAHHRLMMKLHPDHGGSTFLAAQINRAKDILLGG